MFADCCEVLFLVDLLNLRRLMSEVVSEPQPERMPSLNLCAVLTSTSTTM